jgi:hypothetical protein
MKMNAMIGRKLNQDNRKLHFNAAKSIMLQHPGSLQSKKLDHTGMGNFDPAQGITSSNLSIASKG